MLHRDHLPRFLHELPRYKISWDRFFAISILPKRVVITWLEIEHRVRLETFERDSEPRAPRLAADVALYKCHWSNWKRWLLVKVYKAKWDDRCCYGLLYRPVIRVPAKSRTVTATRGFINQEQML